MLRWCVPLLGLAETVASAPPPQVGGQAEACTSLEVLDDLGHCSSAPASESVLLQSRVALGLERFNDQAKLHEEAAWSAGPFGECVRCTGGAKRRREVECRALFSGGMLRQSLCSAAAPRPATQEACDCDEAPCRDGDCDEGTLAAKSAAGGGDDAPRSVDVPYRAIGCLELSADVDAVGGGVAPPQGGDAQDAECIGWKGAGACSGGLPFYRMRSNAMSPSLCFSFCLQKGLDLFGVASSGDCRCGASALNTAVWRGKAPPAGLALAMEELRPATSEDACPVRVYRYVGHFQDGGVPFEMTDATVGDEAYIDSIVAGHPIRAESEEDTEAMEEKERELVAPRRKGGDAQALGWGQPAWARPCWPNNCGPGGGAWKKRRGSILAGMAGKWQEYTIVEYFFEPEVDDTRRTAFRKAVDAWHSSTCIHFVEAAAEPPPPALIVSNREEEKEHCYSTHIGFPGYSDYAGINLGWCSDERYVGNIVHELGHVIGMNHEQKRADAVEGYFGHGPHLKVHWENVGHWADQYHADPDSYVGSSYDGPGDPHAGYAAYDFGSIMHYPTGNHFETIPAENGVLTGNRRTLSEGDVLQVLDMYQCKLRR